MNIAALLARLALLREQIKKQPCQRCGQLYDHQQEAKCPVCGDLDEAGLQALRERQEEAYQGRRSLGMIFWGGAVLAAVILILAL